MRVLVQRSGKASVVVSDKIVGSIDSGLVLLVGFTEGDTKEKIEYLAKKVVNLRIFPDENDKMNRSILDIHGEMLIVSQFTLCGDCKKGTRPSFDKSAAPDIANKLYEDFVKEIQNYGIKTETGVLEYEKDFCSLIFISNHAGLGRRYCNSSSSKTEQPARKANRKFNTIF